MTPGRTLLNGAAIILVVKVCKAFKSNFAEKPTNLILGCRGLNHELGWGESCELSVGRVRLVDMISRQVANKPMDLQEPLLTEFDSFWDLFEERLHILVWIKGF